MYLHNITSIATIDTLTYTKDINVLPEWREEIKGTFEALEWVQEEPKILGVDIRSKTAFSVALNGSTVMSSVLVDTEYVVEYVGTVSFVVFSADVTLTSINLKWSQDRQNHFLVTFSGAVILETDFGTKVYPTKTANQFELKEGWYAYKTTELGEETKVFINSNTKTVTV